jgi:hypothetical protein
MERGGLPPPLQSEHWHDQGSRGKPRPEESGNKLPQSL